MNEHPSPELEKELRETLNEPNANPVFVRDLRATLIERSTMKQRTRFFARLAWSFALAILLITILIASPRTVNALKHIFGYIPDIGYVEPGASIRMLSAPVTDIQNALSVTVEKGTIDSQHTVLLVRIEGYSSDPYRQAYCDTPARLILADGTTLDQTQSEYSMNGAKGNPNGSYYGRFMFEALPADQLDVSLDIPCVMNDSNFTDFKFRLHFEIAKATDVLPVIELPTTINPTATPPSNPTLASGPASLEGFSIMLERETVLDDGYILAGSYQWTDPRFEAFSVYPFDPHFTDARGAEVNFEGVDPGTTNREPGVRKIPFAFHIIGKDYAFPLTLSIPSVTVNLPDTATFPFDAGTNPQVGQTWNVDINVSLAGHTIHVQTIQLTAGRTPTQLGYTFTMTSDPGVMGVSISDADPGLNSTSTGGGGGGGGGISTGPIQYGWALDGYSPAGIKTFAISNLAVMLPGLWQTTWEPSKP